MGSSHSSAQPQLVQRRSIQCNSNGIGQFSVSTLNGQPGRPGLYKIVCNVNINQVHVRGLMVNGQVTRATFNGTMPTGNTRVFRYIPMQANTPYLKGFQGQFTAIPNRTVGFEMWWMPLQ